MFQAPAGGWLDSKIREGNLVRHLSQKEFRTRPAADAAVWMDAGEPDQRQDLPRRARPLRRDSTSRPTDTTLPVLATCDTQWHH